MHYGASMVNRMPPPGFPKLPRKKNVFTLLGYLFFIILLLSLPLTYLTIVGIPVPGRIVYSDGRVTVVRNARETEKGTSAELYEGDYIITKRASRIVVAFKNSISLRLSRDTEIEITKLRLYSHNLFDFLKGKSSSLFAIGGELTLLDGALWIDKKAGALFKIRAGDAVIYPGRAACEVLKSHHSLVSVSVYRGHVKVGFEEQPDFKPRIFPGQEFIIKSRKIERVLTLRYREYDSWQNWNMALSYVAPPMVKLRQIALQQNGWRPAITPPPDKGMIKRPQPEHPKSHKADEDKANLYSFKKWVEEKTEGGKLPYPKYTPNNDKLPRLPFSEFPEGPPTVIGSSGRDGSNTSLPPEPPVLGPEGISGVFSSRYSGASFTPVWGTADEGSSASGQPSAKGGGKKQVGSGQQKPDNGGQNKNEWLPFVQEDNLPPPPPSLNDIEE